MNKRIGNTNREDEVKMTLYLLLKYIVYRKPWLVFVKMLKQDRIQK